MVFDPKSPDPSRPSGILGEFLSTLAQGEFLLLADHKTCLLLAWVLVLSVCSLNMSILDHKAKFYGNVLCAFKRFDNPAQAGVFFEYKSQKVATNMELKIK